MFGWVPALSWILIGAVFVGGVHDFTTLVASIRHKAHSIAEVVRDNMSRRSYLLFLAFVWLALIYIIVAFTDITASSFIGRQELENEFNPRPEPDAIQLPYRQPVGEQAEQRIDHP